MCLAVLALDRNYTDVRPRRPEGGPDEGRDLQCLRDSQICFGAVGFFNSVADSPTNKRLAKKKFKDDLDSALRARSNLRAFVFFTNVDLTPGEVEALAASAQSKGVSFVDIYYRERIRQVLDGPEGLGIRYQYLQIYMSKAEQTSFFSRWGSDLQRLVAGGFHSIERKIDHLEFAYWKTGTLREIRLELRLRQHEQSLREAPEHFRVFVELQSVLHEKRSIVIGGRDDFWQISDGRWCFATKTFFWRQSVSQADSVWIRSDGTRVGGGIISSLSFRAGWFPQSPILIAEFEGLGFNMHITENLTDRIDRVTLILDSYVLVDREIKQSEWEEYQPCFLGPMN